MLKPRFIAGLSSVGLMALSGLVHGQDYPNKPIRISTGGVGGGTDFASRLIAHGLGTSLRQQVVVENYLNASFKVNKPTTLIWRILCCSRVMS